MFADIVIVEESQVSQELNAKLKKLLCKCFPKDKAVFSETRYWNNVPPKWPVAIEEDDSPIACCAVIERQINIADKPYIITGIGNVCVDPDYRGKGLAKKILVQAMIEAENRGYDFGILFCKEKIKDVYEKMGWLLISNTDIVRLNENGQPQSWNLWRGQDVMMYFPLKTEKLPQGVIHLNGLNWQGRSVL